MSPNTNPDDPLGATLYTVGNENHFTYFSRGDLVYGRMRVLSSSQAQPLVIILAADGSALDPLIDQAFARWSEWATVASIDLPLCGRRTSDKFSEAAFDPNHPICDRVRGDLEAQIGADLERLVVLMRQKTVGESRVGLVGVGPRAAYAQSASHGMIASFHGEDAVGGSWFEDVGTRLRRQLG